MSWASHDFWQSHLSIATYLLTQVTQLLLSHQLVLRVADKLRNMIFFFGLAGVLHRSPSRNYLLLCEEYIFVVSLEILRHEVEIRCVINECEVNQVSTQEIPRFLSTLAKIVWTHQTQSVTLALVELKTFISNRLHMKFPYISLSSWLYLSF